MCCVRSKIEPKQIRRSVPTRWNSVADMLNSALDIRPALEKLVDLDRHNQVAKTRLRRFKLTPDEWKILTQLRPILQHFLHATFRLSQRHIPLLYEVIPVIDILTEKLEEAADNSSLLKSVRSGAMKGLAILNKYYSKTDESIMYRITMSKCHSILKFLSLLIVYFSPQSKIQTDILSVKEMASRMGRCSVDGIARSLDHLLQAVRNSSSCTTSQ